MDSSAKLTKHLPGNQSINCRQCGIELRESDSDVCPKCGAPKFWKKIAYFSWADFNLAVILLEEAGILIIKNDAGLGIGGYVRIVTGHAALSEIWIGLPDIEKALEVLESANLTIPAPLVDREEPICPICNNQLDLDGPTICKACNEPFCWFDINDPVIDDEYQQTSPSSAPSRAQEIVSKSLLISFLLLPIGLILLFLVLMFSVTVKASLTIWQLVIGAASCLFLAYVTIRIAFNMRNNA